MPKWIEERARHISARNPYMPETEAWAIATQQSHALGKTPKSYGTAEGKATARAKFDTPKDDEHKANPGKLESPKMGEITKHGGATIIPDDRPMWTGSVGGPNTREQKDLKEHQEGVDSSISKGAEVSPAVTWDGTVRGGGKQVSQMPPFRMPSLRKEAFFSELSKLGAISDEEAAKALERYEALEKNKATPRQAARYGALGAVTAPVMSAVSDVVGGNPLFGGGSVKQRLRNVAGKAIGGAIGMGGLPLVRQHLDRQSEMNTLKSYMNQPHLEQERSMHTAGKLVAPFEVAEKTAFETSMYSGPLGPVSFRQSSGVPPMRVPSLAAPLEKKSYGEVEKAASTATTAAGRLASSMKVGLPKLTAPSGPSIAQVAKPVGFGKPLAGANKTTI